MPSPHSHRRLPQNDWMEEYCHRGISPNSSIVEWIDPQKYSPFTFSHIFIWATMKRQRIEKHWKSWFNKKWKLFQNQLFSDAEFVTLWMSHRICQIILRKVDRKKWKMAANKLFICEFQWMIIVRTIWHNSFHVKFESILIVIISINFRSNFLHWKSSKWTCRRPCSLLGRH